MRFPIDQEIEARKQIKKTKQILAECEEQEKEWRIKEQEEIWRIKMDQNNLKKEFNVAIEEIEIVKENITFKITGKLN